MITHNNFFSGELGKLKNIGGSRAYTIPNTVAVNPSFSVDTDVPAKADFIASSLDGRLVLFKGDKLFYIAVCYWRPGDKKLSYLSVQTFSLRETVLAMGIDWLLTDKQIFMINNKLPYKLSKANLYIDYENKNLRTSLLRKFVPEVKNDSFVSYSFLPSVGDWILFENSLIRKPNKPLSDSYNYMLNMRPLIPLEFLNQLGAFYGLGYNLDKRTIHFAYVNGDIWARGFNNIGRVSLLPAVLDENNNPLEFYLYISHELSLVQKGNNISYFSSNVHYFNGHSFYYCQSTQTWHNAKAICETLGGHLATGENKEKNDFLSNIKVRSLNTWLGGTNENNNESKWYWINGETWDFSNNFTSNESDETYYLYQRRYSTDWGMGNGTEVLPFICEWDYIIQPENSSDKFAIFKFYDDSIVAVKAPNQGSLNNNLCIKADEAKIFFPKNNAWLDLSKDNSALFLDVISSQAVLLHDNGLDFIKYPDQENIESYECKALNQWIAPAGVINSINDNHVIADYDNSSVLTAINGNFYRQLIHDIALPLSAQTFKSDDEQNFRLALAYKDNSSNKKSLLGYCIPSNDEPIAPIAWESIYKQPITFNVLGHKKIPFIGELNDRFFLKYAVLEYKEKTTLSKNPANIEVTGWRCWYGSGYNGDFSWFMPFYGEYMGTYSEKTVHKLININNLDELNQYVGVAVKGVISHFDPISGNIKDIPFNIELPKASEESEMEWIYDSDWQPWGHIDGVPIPQEALDNVACVYFRYLTAPSYTSLPKGFQVKDGVLGLLTKKLKTGSSQDLNDDSFFPIVALSDIYNEDISDILEPYSPESDIKGLIFSGLKNLNNSLNSDNTFLFKEPITNTSFLFIYNKFKFVDKFNLIFYSYGNKKSMRIFEDNTKIYSKGVFAFFYDDKSSKYDIEISNESSLQTSLYDVFFIEFEILYDIFNFYQEYKRSFPI